MEVGRGPHRLSPRPGPRPRHPHRVERSEEETAQIAALSEEYDALVSEWDAVENLPPKVEARFKEIDAALDAFGDGTAFDPEEIARGGVFVILGQDGVARVERGLIRPEDVPAPEPDPEPKAGAGLRRRRPGRRNGGRGRGARGGRRGAPPGSAGHGPDRPQDLGPARPAGGRLHGGFVGGGSRPGAVGLLPGLRPTHLSRRQGGGDGPRRPHAGDRGQPRRAADRGAARGLGGAPAEGVGGPVGLRPGASGHGICWTSWPTRRA